MDIFYWIVGIVTFGVFVYLIIALLKPEMFS
ncbi:MAG: potassium-transporting ATPase subunit F [Dissulfurimicrobium sp.]|nr:potassium-transporting ATPase subunit F [Dissulfurimicrobium hydrothermale]UKL14526.1 potassium-transporting ATPase subunit F [Dissulfurimicrobium hydrothermale]